MTKEEYTQNLNEAEKDFIKAKNKIHTEYALSNAKFKVGDIIKDHRWIILVDKISVYVSFGEAEAVYHGIELKKDLTPKKNDIRQAIYGHHLVELVK